MGRRVQIFSQPADALVVQAVNLRMVVVQYLCQPAIFFNFNTMCQVVSGKVVIIVANLTRELFGQVLVQVATQGDVDNLQAPADTEERFTSLDGCLHQVNLQSITRCIDPLHLRVRLVTVAMWVDIITTCEKDAIQPPQERIQVIPWQVEGDEDRYATSSRNRSRIGLINGKDWMPI